MTWQWVSAAMMCHHAASQRRKSSYFYVEAIGKCLVIYADIERRYQ